MAAHSGQHMVAILPGGRCEYQVGFRIDVGKDIHAHALAGNEAVPAASVNWEGAPDGDAGVFKASRQLLLQIFLGRPANLIGR